MSEGRETDPLLGARPIVLGEDDSATDIAIASKVTRFLWSFSIATFTLSTILLFSAPFAVEYLDIAGTKDLKPCTRPRVSRQISLFGSEALGGLGGGSFNSLSSQGLYNSFKEPKETYLIRFKVKATGPDFAAGNYSSIQLVSLGTTSPRKTLFKNRFPGLGDFSASESQERQRQLDSSVLDFHSHEVYVNKFLAARETLGPLKKEGEKAYIIEFIGSCRHELSRKVFSQVSLQLTRRQRYRIRRWRDGKEIDQVQKAQAKSPAYELISIVNSGPPENRIDVVFMGDGYTQEEREKFIEDISRLSQDMFEGETFRPWLPLINVWAVFVPSNDSGIGVGGTPKDTPFGLYRDGTELRGIYTSKPEVAQSICEDLGPLLCDFPSLIANDDFYGGLGGEYIISTRSLKSGTVVLRHEMGHTFNEVGEEYDGGEVYEGVNSAASFSNIPWRHWLDKGAREEKNNLVFQKYPWYDLTKNGPYVLSFNTSGQFPRWYLGISTSGMANNGSFRVTLDGTELPWSPPGTLDRTFSSWFNDTNGLSRGSHQLQFEAKKGLPEGKIIHQLCNIELMEYASEKKFNWNDFGHVGIYPTYNYEAEKTYRPTNEYCLMRNMTSAHFCPVCKEGLWLKFLDRVSLLDDLDIRSVRFLDSAHPTGLIAEPDHRHFRFADVAEPGDENASTFRHYSGYLVEAKLLEVAPLPGRKSHAMSADHGSKNRYTIRWFHNSRRVHALDDQATFLVCECSRYAVGVWEVLVTFATPQVRKDPNRLLTSHELFVLKRPV